MEDREAGPGSELSIEGADLSEQIIILKNFSHCIFHHYPLFPPFTWLTHLSKKEDDNENKAVEEAAATVLNKRWLSLLHFWVLKN